MNISYVAEEAAGLRQPSVCFVNPFPTQTSTFSKLTADKTALHVGLRGKTFDGNIKQSSVL